MRLPPLLVLLLSFHISSAFADAITVVTENWPPFNYKNEQGKIVGSVTKHVEEILALSQLPYNLVIYPWARSYQLAQTQPNFLIYSIVKTPEREALFHWFCPLNKTSPVYLFKLATSNISITSLEAAKAYRIGVTRDGTNHQYLLSANFVEGENIYLSSSEIVNIYGLFKGNIDLVVQSSKSLKFRLDQINKNMDEVVPVFQLHKDIEGNHCMALSLSSSNNVKKKLEHAFEQWQQLQKENNENNDTPPK